MKCEFFFEEMPVGVFIDPEEYPESSGTYKYMVYRGGGWEKLDQLYRDNGNVCCTFVNDGVNTEIVVRFERYGELEIVKMEKGAPLRYQSKRFWEK